MITVNIDTLLSELDRLADCKEATRAQSTHFAIGYLCALNTVRQWAVTHTTYWPDSYQEAVEVSWTANVPMPIHKNIDIGE